MPVLKKCCTCNLFVFLFNSVVQAIRVHRLKQSICLREAYEALLAVNPRTSGEIFGWLILQSLVKTKIAFSLPT